MNPDNTLFATSMNKTVAYLEKNTLSLYYVSGYNCPCGNQCAKRVIYRDLNNSTQFIIVCSCSQYAIESKRI